MLNTQISKIQHWRSSLVWRQWQWKKTTCKCNQFTGDFPSTPA